MGYRELRVHIVCYEDLDAWILGKFAKKLGDELQRLGIKSDISKTPDPSADINHHITFHSFNNQKSSIDTLMITHVDCLQKVLQIKKQLGVARMGICMSHETRDQLIEAGLPKERLSYINPAQDDVIKPRKYILGITHKTHSDLRKNPNDLLTICDAISPDDFCFKIMGSGWNDVVTKMREKGFSIEYYDRFDRDIYNLLIPSLDYYIFYGFDEGSMGYLDALAAGIKTIVTPQGYHLDTKHGITHAIRSTSDIIKVLHDIANKRKIITDSVKDWTWENYTKNHLNIWMKLIEKNNDGNESIKTSYSTKVSLSTKMRRQLYYTFKPLTITRFLWILIPEALKNHYRKKNNRSS